MQPSGNQPCSSRPTLTAGKRACLETAIEVLVCLIVLNAFTKHEQEEREKDA